MSRDIYDGMYNDSKYSIQGVVSGERLFRLNTNIESTCLDLENVSKELDSSYEEYLVLIEMLSESQWIGDRRDAFESLVLILGKFQYDLKEALDNNKSSINELKNLAEDYPGNSPTVRIMEE